MRSETRLDDAIFQLNAERTRCELWVSAGNETEKLASGSLKPFLAHLREAHNQIVLGSTSIKLQVPSGATNGRTYVTSWFTKGTMERFVRFVTTPDVLERVSIVEAERRQLEEAINILSAGEHQSKGDLENEEDVTDVESNGDASKNQLLVAMDARRIMLQKEQVNAFARASAAGFDMGCMADLMDFAECFGASRLREACLKFASIYKKMQEKGQLEDVDIDADFVGGDDSTQKAHRVRKTWGGHDRTAIDQLHQSNVEPEQPSSPPQHDFRAISDSPPNYGTPSPTPPAEGIGSSQEGTPSSSRRLPRRSASPRRRSASPMRKVQIARSSSRRSPGMVVIRNINYASTSFQDSSRTPPQGGDFSDSGDENGDGNESSESVKAAEEDNNTELKPPEVKPPSAAASSSRMSVQDAINLFERRQKESLEAQAVKATETRRDSGKSVLRRWSSMGEAGSSSPVESVHSTTSDTPKTVDFSKRSSSPAVSSVQKSADSVATVATGSIPEVPVQAALETRELQPAARPPVEERRKSWVATSTSMDLERTFQQLKLQEAALPTVRGSRDTGRDEKPVPPAEGQFGFRYRAERASRNSVSRSWSATSQEDLLSLSHQAEAEPKVQVQQTVEDQGRFYEQYREIRDAKFRQESGSKRAERESKLKAMHEALVKKKAELVPGAGRSTTVPAQSVSKPTQASSRKTVRPTASSTSRSSPTPPSGAAPRATRMPSSDTKSGSARKVSPGGQKPSVSGTSRLSSPKPVSKFSASPTQTQRRPTNIVDNPMTRSMPSLAELRKENTRPTVRSGPPPAQSKTATKTSQPRPAASRHRSISRVMPLESNGTSDTPPAAFPEEKVRKPLKKSPIEDSQVLAPLKAAQVQVQVQEALPVVKPSMQESKPFLRKGRGIGPGAGPGAMKMKAAVATDDVPNDEEDLSSTSMDAEVDVVASRSVRESVEMDIEEDDTVTDNVVEEPALPVEEPVVQPEVRMVEPEVKPVVKSGIPPAPPLNLELLRRSPARAIRPPPPPPPPLQNGGSKLTLMQQLAGGDDFVEASHAVGGFSYIPTGDRRASLPAFGSSPFLSPATTVQSEGSRLRQSVSPDSEGTGAASRKRWEAQKPIQMAHQQQQLHHQELLQQIQQRQQRQQHQQLVQQLQEHQMQQLQNKDGVKGFKRLLKFGRKSRSSNNSNGNEWVSASGTSEGEDTDESSGGAHHFHHPRDINGNGKSSFFSLSSFRSKGRERA